MGANEDPAEINGANKKNDKTQNYSSSIIPNKSSGHLNIKHFPQPTHQSPTYYSMMFSGNYNSLSCKGNKFPPNYF